MILKLTQMENRIIDFFKMDIEVTEKSVIADLNMSYACKYIKQLVFETHWGTMRFSELVKLEQCFLLFRRDTRFFLNNEASPDLGMLTEFQLPNGFRLDLKSFYNETFLAEYMFVNGELYFVNKNFLT
jgi:hypothetical protein